MVIQQFSTRLLYNRFEPRVVATCHAYSAIVGNIVDILCQKLFFVFSFARIESNPFQCSQNWFDHPLTFPDGWRTGSCWDCMTSATSINNIIKHTLNLTSPYLCDIKHPDRAIVNCHLWRFTLISIDSITPGWNWSNMQFRWMRQPLILITSVFWWTWQRPYGVDHRLGGTSILGKTWGLKWRKRWSKK